MHNHTADRLQRLSPKIMDTWAQRALSEIAAAQHQEDLALRNSLPVYLTQLVDALSTIIDRTHARKIADKLDSTRIGKKHGGERALSHEYSMDQMILEYHILRQVICDVMEEEAPLTQVEREVIVCSVEQAVNDAATQFSDTLSDIQEQFTHTLAHDLRNPLSTIRISSQMITRKPSDEGSALEKSLRISKSVERIESMIQDILDASKIRSGQALPIEFAELDLDWLVRDVAYELNISNEHRLVVKSNGTCTGKWNADGLRRVIENLSTNAIKYGQPNSQVTLMVENDQTSAKIKVHNHGEGIPLEEQQQLFQTFKRGKSTTKILGWGIGLTVVKGIVDAHKGQIKVESNKQDGTTFIVQIPKNPTAIVPS